MGTLLFAVGPNDMQSNQNQSELESESEQESELEELEAEAECGSGKKSSSLGEYLRPARAARYFSNVFTRKGLALTHLPKMPPKER